jgi:peptide/nickel transport system permease protein
MPGDPTRVLIPKGNVSDELRENLTAAFYLDKPLHEQLARYIWQVLTLDLGITSSYLKGGVPIADIIGPKILNTVVLVGAGTALAVFMGVMLGRFAAWRRGSPADAVSMSFALVFYSMPTFLFALILLLVFSGELGWFPLSHSTGPVQQLWPGVEYEEMNIGQKLVSRAYHLVLPLLAFTLEIMAEFALIMRNSLTDVLTEDYITTARAKGVSNKAILNEHAMRNALLPVVTVMAISIGWVLGGTIMVEMVFSYEGLGLLTWDAVNARDFPLLQALFLIMAIAVLLANLIADIIYTYLDPRVKI